jgi:hypothetical protein
MVEFLAVARQVLSTLDTTRKVVGSGGMSSVTGREDIVDSLHAVVHDGSLTFEAVSVLILDRCIGVSVNLVDLVGETSRVECRPHRSKPFRANGRLYSILHATRLVEVATDSHPPTVWVREDHLLEGIVDFFGERVFGPQRRELLEHDLRSFDGEPERKRQHQMRSLRRAMEKLDSAQTRLVRKLELDDDPEGVLFRRVRERLSELEDERLLKFNELQALEAEQLETGPEAVELLDELPIGEGLFASAPDDVLRQLFQTFRLEVRFDKPSHRANCQVTIDEGSVASLGSDSAEHSVSPGWCTDVGSAPGGNRTTWAPVSPAVSRQLVVEGSFIVPTTPWTKR